MGASVGVQLGRIPISFKGYFNFQDVYKAILKWMDEEHLTYVEKLYKNKPSDGGTREIEIKMSGSNEVDLFHKFTCNVEMHIWDLVDVEIEQNGKRVKTNRGRIEINIGGEVERDWQGKFETASWLMKLRKLLLNLQYNDEDFKYWEPYHQKVWGLHVKLKQIMNIPTTSTVYGAQHG